MTRILNHVGPLSSPIHNIGAEQALLGALLLEADTVLAVEGVVRPEHFAEPLHGRLFAAILQNVQQGRGVAPAILAPMFEHDPAFAEMGGVGYLGTLIEYAPPPVNAVDFAREIAAAFTRRDLMRVGAEIAHLGQEGGDPDELVAKAERLVTDLGDGAGCRENWIDGQSVIKRAIASARNRSGVMDCVTGVEDLDEFLGGFNRGELVIIAGRPGMAKSIVASQCAKANASDGAGVVFFSQEMGEEPLGLRLACDLAYDRSLPVYMGATSNITFDHARKNRLSPDEWHKLEAAQDVAHGWPLLFDTRPALTVSQMEQAARRAFRRWKRRGIKPSCIIVDHLGLIRAEKDRQGSKHAETADVSHALAAMAKRLDVAVICLCQLNRQVEGRGEDKRPTLADLRQAGEIEEDARVVIFLLRPAYYLRPPDHEEDAAEAAQREAKLQRCRNQLLWIVAKNNNGLTGQVETFIDVGCAAIRSRIAA